MIFNNYSKSLIRLISFSLLGAGALSAAASESIDQKAESILKHLTLEQKVAQMIQGEIRHVSPADVKKYSLGSVLNGGGSFPNQNKHATQEEWLKLADAYYESSLESSAGIPLIWGTDAVHGHNNVIGATLFPHNIGLGAANNSDLMRAIGVITAEEVAATGIDWIFAPTVAVVKDDRWGRTYEGYSDRPEIVSRYASEIVEGLQANGIVATAKHFIGDGGTFRGVDQGNTELDLRQLLEQHGPGYLKALDAGVLTVMASFNSWNGDKIHGNKELLTDVLKGAMRFEGFVVSDWNGIGQVEGCENNSCPQAINAGIDMVMAPEDWESLHANMVKQVETGLIPMARIDDAVLRILKVKLKAGLFDTVKPSQRKAVKSTIIGSKASREIARQAVRESLVMLKNNGKLLPLNPKQRILVTGNGADDIGQQNGGWTISWQGTGNTNDDFPGATSIFDGIRSSVQAAGGTVELSADGSFSHKPDVAVVVFGELPYAEGVGDVDTLAWQQGHQADLKLLRSLKNQGIPVVSVLLTGRPLWLNAELNASDAFVVAWLPGSEGVGVADVLMTDKAGSVQYDFKGKLSFDWPNADLNRQDRNLPVSDTLFPYGYGLSYSEHQSVRENLPEKPVGNIVIKDKVIFDKETRSPWNLLIGDDRNWHVPVVQKQQKTKGKGLSISSVDYQVQEDAKKIVWHEQGKKLRQVFWQSDSPSDFSELHKLDGALTVEFKLDQHPKGKVSFRMDCGWPCTGSMKMSPLLSQMPLGQWARVSIPLECFEQSGTNLKSVDSPLTIVSDREFSMTVSKVVIEENPASNSILNCK